MARFFLQNIRTIVHLGKKKLSFKILAISCTPKCIDLISRGRGDYFPSLHIDRGAAEVNMAREIFRPVLSRPREIRVLSQEDLLAHH